MNPVFGRTNIPVPDVWLRLVAGDDPAALASAAIASGLPLDLSSQPALWGGLLRTRPEFEKALIMARSSIDFERATDEDHAVHLVHAHLIEVLSALGRGSVDFYFVRIRRGLAEFQINGVLQALELAREDGLFRFTGLAVEGPALVVRGVWQSHDAFEALLVGPEGASLLPVASDRRVGVLHEGEGTPRLITVRNVNELEAAIGPARV